jgi:hypothetical protein
MSQTFLFSTSADSLQYTYGQVWDARILLEWSGLIKDSLKQRANMLPSSRQLVTCIDSNTLKDFTDLGFRLVTQQFCEEQESEIWTNSLI